MDFLRTWIINIITVVMIAAFADMLIPEGSFKKYTKVIVGLIIMVIIIQPLVVLSRQEVLLHRLTFETSHYIDRMSVIEASSQIEQAQAQQIVTAYQSQLTVQIQQRVQNISQDYDVRVKVDTDGNINSSGFGAIRYIEVTLVPPKKEGEVEVIAPIAPLEISSQTQKEMDEEKKVAKTPQQQALIQEFGQYLQSIYNIPKENIVVKIQK